MQNSKRRLVFRTPPASPSSSRSKPWHQLHWLVLRPANAETSRDKRDVDGPTLFRWKALHTWARTDLREEMPTEGLARRENAISALRDLKCVLPKMWGPKKYFTTKMPACKLKITAASTHHIPMIDNCCLSVSHPHSCCIKVAQIHSQLHHRLHKICSSTSHPQHSCIYLQMPDWST